MKHSIIKCLILSLLPFLFSCRASKDCVTSAGNNTGLIGSVIELDSNSPALYSADFDIMKVHFSGLIAFRKMPVNNETRIVFLTETGIRMMEYRYSGVKMENTYSMEAMKKKSTIKFIGRFLKMLLIKPECKLTCTTSQNQENIYFCKMKKGYYTCKSNNGVKYHACLYYGKKNQVEAKYAGSETLPDEIHLILPMHTNIQMKRALNAFK